MDAPLHVTENTPSLTGYPLWRFFGTGVAVSIPKGKWGVITPDDLEKATPKIRKNDIVMINTGTITSSPTATSITLIRRASIRRPPSGWWRSR